MTTEYKYYKNSNTGEVILRQIFTSDLMNFPDCFYDRYRKRMPNELVNLTGFVEIKEKTFKREIRIMRNSTLNSLDEVFDIIKRPPEQKSVKALPDHLQHVFNDLNRAFYNPIYPNEYITRIQMYRADCKQLKKVNWS